MTDRIVIQFRGKQTEHGIKIPALTHNHITAPDRGIHATLFLSSLNNTDITRTRPRNAYRALIGDDTAPLPNYATADNGFTVVPDKSGFMAVATITLDATNIRNN